MRCLILQHDDRPSDPFASLRKLNMQYAQKHGYTYSFQQTISDVPPYWQKIHEIRKAMDEFDIVVFLDTDAVIHKQTKTLASFFPRRSSKAFIYSPDRSPYSASFCAGVMILKTTPRSIAMVDEWLSKYPPHVWTRDEKNHWRCEGCDWADQHYEQGAFTVYIDREGNYKDVLKKVASHILQGDTPPRPDTFIIHFAGMHKKDISGYVQQAKSLA